MSADSWLGSSCVDMNRAITDVFVMCYQPILLKIFQLKTNRLGSVEEVGVSLAFPLSNKSIKIRPVFLVA